MLGGDEVKLHISENAETLLDILICAGHSAYIVGGCVRDEIMGKKPFDFDITTSATADEMLELFSAFQCLTYGAKHGTVAVVFENENIECTTYRTDGNYSDGRHPDNVTFSSNLHDDLSRRDFTVNALAYSKSGDTVDLFGGIDDIKNKIIRAIGDPDKRFTEDALRIMRGLRFSSSLGFSIEKNTGESMIRNSGRLSLVSSERITAEFKKMLVGESIGYVLRFFREIISTVIPEVIIDENVIEKVETCPREYDLRLYTLLKASPEPMEALTNSRIMLTKAEKHTLNSLFSIVKPPVDRTEIKRLLNSHGEKITEKYLRSLSSVSLLSELSSILENGECYTVSELALDGGEISSLGYKGKEIGLIQRKILEEIICGRLCNEKDAIIDFLKKEDSA